jgi:Asp-tRNA(Asn)/Glu-tRNA(Gln) amidotransferase A subunit family amidase
MKGISMQTLTSLSAKELANLIRNKKISCTEVIKAYLDRIAKINPDINAIVELPAPQKKDYLLVYKSLPKRGVMM